MNLESGEMRQRREGSQMNYRDSDHGSLSPPETLRSGIGICLRVIPPQMREMEYL